MVSKVQPKPAAQVQAAMKKATSGTGAQKKIDAKEAKRIVDLELAHVAKSADPLGTLMAYGDKNVALTKQAANSQAAKQFDRVQTSGFSMAEAANTRIAERKAANITKHFAKNTGKLAHPLEAFRFAKCTDSSSDRSYVQIDLDSSKLKKGELLKAPDGTLYPAPSVQKAFHDLLNGDPKLKLPASQFIGFTVDGKSVQI